MINVYTDGSCNVQQRIGGWAVVSASFIESGSKSPTTNNEMELYSILKAMELGETYGYDLINTYSDSQYAISTLTEWAYNWEKNGWTKKGGIKNKELIQKIFYKLKDNPKVRLHKVKAHDGNEMNEKADRLAKESYVGLLK